MYHTTVSNDKITYTPSWMVLAYTQELRTRQAHTVCDGGKVEAAGQ